MTLVEVQTLIACPICHGSLDFHREAYRCPECGVDFPIIEGIPVLLPDSSVAEHDELEHAHGGHKRAQAAYYDSDDAAEFEIQRPNGAPAFYEWLMREKFKYSLPDRGRGSRWEVSRSLALTVCGGSGMEAQFLAEVGFDVIASDISLGAARRCRERARRYGLQLFSLVADVEHLPFRDRSIPLVYVHDGLHHLDNPMAGLAEMMRVAADAISLTEPAEAAATAVAVRMGISLAYEAPGNRVARLQPAVVAPALRRSGFEVVRAQRYAMFYRHHPGPIMRLFSVPRLLPVAQLGLRAANALVGRWGNKLSVSGLRHGRARQPLFN